MLLSIAVYAQLFGWKYSVGFVLLLLCHEMGHYIAARQRGLSVSLPTFIPFVGAWISLKNQVMDAETTAFVGMAGPLLGSTAAFLVYLYAVQTQNTWLLAVAFSGFVLNLFNLIPVVPLDGGHIVAVISTKIWIIGVPILIALCVWRPNPLLIIVAALKVRYMAEYLGLVCFLGLMAVEVHHQISPHG
jgi:Zn-dependent protease